MGRDLPSHTDIPQVSTWLRGEDRRQKPREFSLCKVDQMRCGCGWFTADPRHRQSCAELESGLSQAQEGPHWSCFQLAWSLGVAVWTCSGDGYFPFLSATSDGEDRGIISGRVEVVSWPSCPASFANLPDFPASVCLGPRKTQN